MGTYDTIRTEKHEFQTKAFGKNLHTYSLGDHVDIIPAPMTFEETLTKSGPLNIDHMRCQVDVIDNETFKNGFALIEDATLTHVGFTEFNGVMKFNFYGHRKN